ncbi:heterokaryon incompatibility, partial [Halenospora varia]
NLEVDLDFEAVSYFWGEPAFTESFIINDAEEKIITSSLRDALIRFRHPRDGRMLWVDALCIDQLDDDDKGRQILRMGGIYQDVSAVLIWLGNYEEEVACLRAIDSWAKGLTVHAEDVIQEMIDRLLRLPWFSRPWVL